MASTTLLLTALVSAVAGDASCFADYAIDRLYKTKYEVCSGGNSVGSEFFEVTNVSLSAPYDRHVGRHVLSGSCLEPLALNKLILVSFS